MASAAAIAVEDESKSLNNNPDVHLSNVDSASSVTRGSSKELMNCMNLEAVNTGTM